MPKIKRSLPNVNKPPKKQGKGQRTSPKEVLKDSIEGYKGRHIKVFDEKGKPIFDGKGRRRYREQVVFDSLSDSERVFRVAKTAITDKRVKTLKEKGFLIKETAGEYVFRDERNRKHRKIYVDER